MRINIVLTAMVAKVQQVESGIMAHFLFCVSMGGSQRYSVEFCFLYTLCIIVCAALAKFYKVRQVEFHTRFGGRERQQSKFTSSLFTLFPPFTKQQRRLVRNIFNGIKLWFAKQMNQISTVTILAMCPGKNSRQL